MHSREPSINKRLWATFGRANLLAGCGRGAGIPQRMGLSWLAYFMSYCEDLDSKNAVLSSILTAHNTSRSPVLEACWDPMPVPRLSFQSYPPSVSEK